MSRNAIVDLDVRDDIKSGREPFSRIMQTVASLTEGQSLRLIAPLEPTPLYSVLARQGFHRASKELESGDFEVLFSRDPEALKPHSPESSGKQDLHAGTGHRCPGPSVIGVDTRGQEPPQPMVSILEAIATLPEGASLRAHTDRRPIHLYSQLEERGLTWETQEQSDGSFVTYVRGA